MHLLRTYIVEKAPAAAPPRAYRPTDCLDLPDVSALPPDGAPDALNLPFGRVLPRPAGARDAAAAAKVKRPRVDWVINPPDLLGDAAWTEKDRNKAKLEDKDGNKLFRRDAVFERISLEPELVPGPPGPELEPLGRRSAGDGDGRRGRDPASRRAPSQTQYSSSAHDASLSRSPVRGRGRNRRRLSDASDSEDELDGEGSRLARLRDKIPGIRTYYRSRSRADSFATDSSATDSEVSSGETPAGAAPGAAALLAAGQAGQQPRRRHHHRRHKVLHSRPKKSSDFQDSLGFLDQLVSQKHAAAAAPPDGAADARTQRRRSLVPPIDTAVAADHEHLQTPDAHARRRERSASFGSSDGGYGGDPADLRRQVLASRRGPSNRPSVDSLDAETPARTSAYPSVTISLSPPSSVGGTLVASGRPASRAPSPAVDGDHDLHTAYLRRCLDLARLSPPKPTNFCVGSILLRRSAPHTGGGGGTPHHLAVPSDRFDDTILSTGYTLELEGNTHAEQCCLAKLEQRHASDATSQGTAPTGRIILYVTMEPCGHRLSGNEPCAKRIAEFRAGGISIDKVYFGVKEPGTFVGQSAGCRLLDEAGIDCELVPGLERDILEVAMAGHQLTREQMDRAVVEAQATQFGDGPGLRPPSRHEQHPDAEPFYSPQSSAILAGPGSTLRRVDSRAQLAVDTPSKNRSLSAANLHRLWRGSRLGEALSHETSKFKDIIRRRDGHSHSGHSSVTSLLSGDEKEARDLEYLQLRRSRPSRTRLAAGDSALTPVPQGDDDGDGGTTPCGPGALRSADEATAAADAVASADRLGDDLARAGRPRARTTIRGQRNNAAEPENADPQSPPSSRAGAGPGADAALPRNGISRERLGFTTRPAPTSNHVLLTRREINRVAAHLLATGVRAHELGRQLTEPQDLPHALAQLIPEAARGDLPRARRCGQPVAAATRIAFAFDDEAGATHQAAMA
ncbi:hypothetical protein KEM52_001958, partial [Ascosphaera acerosa]